MPYRIEVEEFSAPVGISARAACWERWPITTRYDVGGPILEGLKPKVDARPVPDLGTSARRIPDISWVTETRPDDSTSEELMTMIEALHDIMGARDFKLLDAILESIIPQRLSPAMLVGLLRVSRPVRSKLRQWKPLLQRVQSELAERNFDTVRVLHGLH